MKWEVLVPALVAIAIFGIPFWRLTKKEKQSSLTEYVEQVYEQQTRINKSLENRNSYLEERLEVAEARLTTQRDHTRDLEDQIRLMKTQVAELTDKLLALGGAP